MSSGKSSKQPPASPVGQSMEQVLASLKAHKVRKSMNEKLQAMHGAVAGNPPQEKTTKTAGLLRTAYLVGMKTAEESVSAGQNNANEVLDGITYPEESVINAFRRGWPDVAKSRKEEVEKREKMRVKREIDTDSESSGSVNVTSATPFEPTPF